MTENLVEICYCDQTPGVISKWKIRTGRRIVENDIIYEYQTSKFNKARSAHAGLVTKILKSENEPVQCGDVLAIIEKCSHVTVWKNICSDCGAIVEHQKGQGKSQNFMAMMHSMPDLLVEENKAKDLGNQHINMLLRNRKLALMVDLDQTIIHTTHSNVPANLKDVHHFQLRQNREWFHTKLRPHTEEFLERISKFFELHIFTLGVKAYAQAIIKYLDPEKKYFHDRVLSRDECLHPTLKTLNLKNLFPSGDSMVCIIDDREDVWKSASNLVRVKPYSFFDGSADINAPPTAVQCGPIKVKEPRQKTILRIPKEKPKISSNNEGGVVNKENSEEEFTEIIEWEDSDDYLLHLERILMKVHGSFYEQYDRKRTQGDLKTSHFVVEEKKKTFQGCNILFSGVVPMNERIETSWVYKAAVKYGANVQTELVLRGDVTTHVIGLRDGTEKIVRAKKHHIPVVNIDWFLDSIEKWEKADESLYPISKEPSQRHLHYFYTSDRESIVEPTKHAQTKLSGRNLLSEKSDVLDGCNILFSGVVPTDQKLETSWAYRLAKNLGANVQTELITGKNSDVTTHVIGMRDGTEKIRKAQKHNIRVVNLDWLLDTREKMKMVDESRYPISEATSHRYQLYRENHLAYPEEDANWKADLLTICNSVLDELGGDDEEGDDEENADEKNEEDDDEENDNKENEDDDEENDNKENEDDDEENDGEDICDDNYNMDTEDEDSYNVNSRKRRHAEASCDWDDSDDYDELEKRLLLELED